MARVFISILGTTNYEPCTYEFQGTIGARETRFVQEATVSLCCQDWTGSDRILIFTTDEAEKKNWLDDGHVDSATKKPIKQEGLKSRLTSLRLKAPIRNVPIPEGKSEKEIWTIFQTIFNNIDEGDDIIFDITHSFRSLPMLVLVVLNYAKVLKKVSLKGIYYGAFEVLGSLSDVKRLPSESRRVPVFDLTDFDRLLEWTQAIGVFLRSGDAQFAVDLARAETGQILRETKGTDEEAKQLKLVADKLGAFTRDVSTCRGLALSNDIKELRQALTQSQGGNMNSPLNPLLKQLSDRLAVFSGDRIKDAIHIVEWCVEHNLIQQGYTILRECLIDYVCSGYRIDLSDFPAREQVEKAIGQDLNMWHNHLRLKRKSGVGTVETFFLTIFQDKLDLLKLFDKLFRLRNDINHAGIRKKPDPANRLIQELSALIEEVKRLLLE